MKPVRGRIEYEFRIVRDVTAPAAARQHLDRIARHFEPVLFDDLRLLVNEVVTNSVRHGTRPGDWIGLRIHADPDLVRVEVNDPGPGFERVRVRNDLQSTGGRGLLLVDRMADEWGVDLESADTCVWFEFHPNGVAQSAHS